MSRSQSEPATYYWIAQETFERDYETALDRLGACPTEILRFQNVLAPKEMLAGNLYSLMGRPEQARASYEKALPLLEAEVGRQPDAPHARLALAATYAGLERKEDAIGEAKRAVELLPVSQDALVGPSVLYDQAIILVRTGEQERALDTLAYALSIPGRASVGLMQLDPWWDPVRDHPRFQHLLQQHSEADSQSPP